MPKIHITVGSMCTLHYGENGIERIMKGQDWWDYSDIVSEGLTKRPMSLATINRTIR